MQNNISKSALSSLEEFESQAVVWIAVSSTFLCIFIAVVESVFQKIFSMKVYKNNSYGQTFSNNKTAVYSIKIISFL